MKKVLFVVSSLNTGGAQRALSNIVTHFPNEWHIDIMLNNKDNIVYPYKGEIIDLRINEPTNRKNYLYQLKVLVNRYFGLKKLKKNNNYVACISFLDSANIVNIITGKKYCKTIVSVRCELSQDKSFTYKYIVNPLVKMLYNKADKIVALSKGVENDLIQNLKLDTKKTSTIYNGYDVQQMQNNAEKYERIKSEFRFITMGRNEYQKGQWHLIRAFSEVVKDNKNVKLVILGEGRLAEYYKKLIQELKIEDRVELKGFVKNTTEELKNSSCFVFPSLFEGFGNALIEGISCGLPVISSDFKSGAREILAPDTDFSYENVDIIEYAKYGILVPVCSGKQYESYIDLEKEEELLADAMKKIMRDVELYNKYHSLSRDCISKFSIDECIKQWVNIIEDGM